MGDRRLTLIESRLKKDILGQLGISESVYDALLEEFVGQAREKISELRTAFLLKDSENARKILHSLKGAAENLRIKKMAGVIDEIRGLAEGGGSENEIEERLNTLEGHASNIEDAF